MIKLKLDQLRGISFLGSPPFDPNSSLYVAANLSGSLSQ